MPGALLHPFAKPTRESFIPIVGGSGAVVYTKDGRELIDGMASLWYCAVGHGRRDMAEAVMYLLGQRVAGAFYRVHGERAADENLNAPGSSFVPLAFEQSAHTPQPGVKPGASSPNRFYMYGVIGRLAMLASSYELESTDPEAENYD